ncbi:hypothetical protein EG329_012238 [Mollisiaceae sp. DMI_Dod_QoI]|nr:hypothetical protein EG329_012238 [Helotiales sp. DMI_Dod_QoI]
MELSNGFSLFQSASLSIRRYNGGLPVLLLQSGIFDRRTWYFLTIKILLSSTTVVSYFLSTGLVSDLGITPIIGDANFAQAPFSINFTKQQVLRSFEPDFSTYTPSIYPAFGEFSEPPSKSQGIDDTGRIMRAILPITSPSTRESLSNFTGTGTLLSTHVLCIKSVLKDFALIAGGGEHQSDPLYVRGSVSIGTSIPDGLTFYNATADPTNSFEPTNFLSFTCSMAKITNSGEWPIAMCVAGNYFGNENITGGGTDGTTRIPTLGLRATSFLNNIILIDPLSYILVNYSGILPASSERQIYTNWTDVSTTDSSWTAMKNTNNISTNLESISISYCFTNFASVDGNMIVTSPASRTEPVLRSLQFSTALGAGDVLKQLGADGSNLTLADRGVLALKPSDQWPSIIFDDPSETTINTPNSQALDGTYGFGMEITTTAVNPSLRTWALCTYCAVSLTDPGGTNITGISVALSPIFQASVQKSGSAAKALNAVLSVMNMVQYYTRYMPALLDFQTLIQLKSSTG